MEPTVQSTIQQQPVEGNKTLRFMTLLVIGVVGLIGAFFVVRNTFNLQNRAATQPPALSCIDNSTGSGYCEIKDIPEGVDLNDLYLTVVQTCTEKEASSTTIVYRQKVQSRGDKYSTRFDVLPGCTYKCQIEIGESGSKVCPGGDEKSLACLPTPTPKCEEECLDGSFKCTEQKDFTKPGLSASCPALNVQLINYLDPKQNSCPNSRPGEQLDCENDKVVVETNEPGKKRELTKEECLELKKSPPDGFLMRLHTAYLEGCRTYNIIAYHKDGSKLKVCENCQLKLGCPASCAPPVELDKDQLIDITINSKKDKLPKGFSPVKCGIIPNTDINCDVDINQNACGKTMTFIPRADGTLYLDDHYNDKPKVVIPAKKNVPIQFTYDNAGHYDVVLSCGDPENNKIDQVCAKRVTVACGAGGGGTGTPTPPTPTLTPTPGLCPILKLEGVC